MADQQPVNRLIIRPNAATLAKILFEGLDPQGVLELKQHIINDFTNKHLKGLVNTEAVQASILRIEKAMENYIQREIGIVKTDWQGRVTDVQLAPDLQRQLQEHVSVRVRTMVEAIIHTRQKPEFESLIRTIVDEELKKVTARTVKKLVTDRMNEVVDKIDWSKSDE